MTAPAPESAPAAVPAAVPAAGGTPARRRLLVGGLVLTLALLTAPNPAAAQDEDDDALDQTLSSDLAVVHGERTLDTGHVDIGPKFDDEGVWRFLIHDDLAKVDANAASVWRYPDETVFHVLDAAQETVPDDAAYAFVGAEPGATVYVAPQTQNPEVVWIGWNTQDPEVMQSIDRGVTLSLTGAQGPGTVTVYLQSGSFGEPQLLWDSRVAEAQGIWVDVNTHTHANWVFTAPGVYLLQVTAQATLLDGSTVSDTQVLRFAVGSAVSPAEALAASWDGASSPAAPSSDDSATPSADDATATQDAANAWVVPILLVLIALVAVGLAAGFTVAIVRGNRAKQRILTSRQRGETAPDDEQGGGRS